MDTWMRWLQCRHCGWSWRYQVCRDTSSGSGLLTQLQQQCHFPAGARLTSLRRELEEPTSWPNGAKLVRMTVRAARYFLIWRLMLYDSGMGLYQ